MTLPRILFRVRTRTIASLFTLLCIMPAGQLAAAEKNSLFGVDLTGGSGSSAVPLQVAILLTLLSLLPAIVMTLTPLLRITLVLHFLRQALGTQTAPSNQVLLGLALFLTSVVTAPLISSVKSVAWEPYSKGSMSQSQALDAASVPVRKFLIRYCREKDLALILDISRAQKPRNSDELPLSIVAPAYILSELRAGFQIGAVLFLPFLVIDLVVASVTLSIGMVQLPPVMLSAPFKLLLFVLVDGWNLLVGSLLKSF